VATDLGDELDELADRMSEPRPLAYLIASVLELTLPERQEILELDFVSERLKRVIVGLQHELAVRRVIHGVTTETADELTKAQRELLLRRHMEAVQRQLGELGAGAPNAAELRRRIESLPLPDEARKEARRELDRLDRIPEGGAEHGVAQTYLEWIAKLPWETHTGHGVDLESARAVLAQDHYDLEHVKERILDHLAVKRLRRQRGSDANGRARGEPILCLAGPPGVGKTSLGRSIARALGRTFVHESLGGVHDEGELRGHRRTYVGAMPGRIVQALARAGAADPVFMLDEIDKLGAGYHGDPAAALLEILDPAQNRAFVDHYLGVPFDLSHVLFVCPPTRPTPCRARSSIAWRCSTSPATPSARRRGSRSNSSSRSSRRPTASCAARW
jgi:ATP-dependent Lon protease